MGVYRRVPGGREALNLKDSQALDKDIGGGIDGANIFLKAGVYRG